MKTSAESVSAPTAARSRLWLAAALFLWLPLCSLLYTTHHLLVEYSEHQSSQALKVLDDFLERIADYDDPHLFWSRVCRGLDARVASSPDSVRRLKREVSRLRHWMPQGAFQLVIFNQRGTIVHQDGVSSMGAEDWTRIQYDLESSLPGDGHEHSLERSKPLGPHWNRLFPGGLMFSRVLTYLLTRRQLVYPLGKHGNARIWWGAHAQGTYILYLTSAAFGEPVGLRHACEYPPFWRHRGLSVGYRDPERPERAFASLPEFRQVLFSPPQTGLSAPRLSHHQWFIASRELPSGKILYAGLRRPLLLCHHGQLVLLCGLLLSVLAIQGTRKIVRISYQQASEKVSVQRKLVLFFLLANGLPLLLLASLSATQLRHREVSLLNDLHTTCTDMIRQFEAGVRTGHERTRKAVLKALTAFEKHLGERRFSEKEFLRMHGDMKRLGASEFILVASSTRDWITSKGYYPEQGRSLRTGKAFDAKREQFFQEGFQHILHTLNGVPAKAVSRFELVIEAMFGISLAEFANNVLTGISRVTTWGDGSSQLITVVKLFRASGRADADYLFMGTFHPNTIGYRYIQEHLHTLNRNRLGLRFFVRSRTPNVLFSIKFRDQPARKRGRWSRTVQLPGDISLPRSLLRHVHSLSPLVTICPEPFQVGNRKYLVIGCSGRELPDFFYFALYPYDRLTSQQGRMRRNLLWFVLLSLTFSAILGKTLGQRLLEPIAVLHAGTQAIRRHQFTHRIPDLGSDEFGRIGAAVNKAMESLEELSLARIVQENLLPDGGFAIRTCRGFGRTVPMSELGGDFFDVLQVGPTKHLLSIGDVAGHGVPAALVMAMAKAVLYRLGIAGARPEVIFGQLNQLLIEMSGHKARRALSLQSVEVDDASDTIRITSSGHCYPVLLTSAGAQLIRFSSTPIGVTSRHRLDMKELAFRPGDAVVLYTDGAIEIADPAGNPLGFERFAALLIACRADDPEEFYHRVMRALKAYRGDQAPPLDDLTVVILMRTTTPEGHPEVGSESPPPTSGAI